MVVIDLRAVFVLLWLVSSLVAGHSALSGGRHLALHRERRMPNVTHGTQQGLVFNGISTFPIGSLASLNLSSACEAALYQTVSCDDATSSLMTTGYVGSFGNSTETSRVCDPGCEASIAQLSAAVSASCGETTGLVPGLPFLDLVNMLWSNWNQSCFEDPTTGQNCNDVIAAFPNVTDLSDLPKSDLCSYCNVKKLALMQADAYTKVYDENWMKIYEYVAQNCDLSVADFNSTPSVFNVTFPYTTPTCVSGNTYTTKKGDTCDSIATTHSVSAATMFYTNPNIANCSSILPGTVLCLPLQCEEIWSVQPDDTCTSIAIANGISTQNVLNYNSQLNWNCTNLHSTNPVWGSTLCVSTPGGTYSGQAPNTTTSTGPEIISPPAGATVAPGTTTDCGGWFVNNQTPELSCAQICLSNQIAINLFTAANPSLHKATCDSDLAIGNAYCIDPLEGWNWGTNSTSNTTTTISSGGSSSTSVTSTSMTSTTATTSISTPTPYQTGMASNCNKFYLVVSGDQCGTIAGEYGISLDQFYLWNPAVGSSCQYLGLGDYVCVDVIGVTPSATTMPTSTGNGITTPTPYQTGMASNCNNFYLVVSGDQCGTIAAEYGISLDQFYLWNPAVGSNCQYLGLGDYVCIDVIGATPSTTTTPTNTGNGITTPTPHQTGMVGNCDKFYLVVSGDGCGVISTNYGISLSQFYSWNPAVGSSCQYLGLGDYVCVGVTS